MLFIAFFVYSYFTDYKKDIEYGLVKKLGKGAKIIKYSSPIKAYNGAGIVYFLYNFKNQQCKGSAVLLDATAWKYGMLSSIEEDCKNI